MSHKIKEIAREKTTWSIGIPSIIIGAMTLLDADHANEVAQSVSKAGESFVETGDWKAAVGWLVAGVAGIFMQGRRK